MLYNGSDVIRDVEWVVFDEVHYINDSEVKMIDDYSHCVSLNILPISHLYIAWGGMGGSADNATRARSCYYALGHST